MPADFMPPIVIESTDPRPRAEIGQTLYERDTGRSYIYEMLGSQSEGWNEVVQPYAAGFVSDDLLDDEGLRRARARFHADLLTILGDCKRLWLPGETDTTTSTDKTRNQVALTHNVTLADRLHALGKGFYVDFDGSTHFSYFADAADLSFGDASLDTGFSVVMLVRIANTANNRTLFGKYTTNQREYRAYIATNDTLQFILYDESTDGTEVRSTDAAVPQDTWALIVLTYDGSEDSDGMTVYSNGVSVASTATSDVGGTYTAMEAGTSVLGIGSGTSAASLPFEGGIAAFALTATVLSADQVWALYNLFDGHYGFLG